MSLCEAEAVFFFFQAEDGIRDLVRSRGLGDVYKRQHQRHDGRLHRRRPALFEAAAEVRGLSVNERQIAPCLLYTSDAADERSSVDLGGRRIIKKNSEMMYRRCNAATPSTRADPSNIDEGASSTQEHETE